METSKVPQGTKTIIKALQILKAFQSGDELELNDIVEYIGSNRSTVHRILQALIVEGFVLQDYNTKKYTLGSSIFKLSNVASTHYKYDKIKAIAIPYMKKLNNITNETIHLSVLLKNKVLCLEKIDSPEPIRLVFRVGSLSDAHSTASGKVLLSTKNDPEIQKYLNIKKLEKRTKNTITEPEKFMQEIYKIREEGYAVDDGESLKDVRQ